MKNLLLAIPLVAAGVMVAGCAASSSSTSAPSSALSSSATAGTSGASSLATVTPAAGGGGPGAAHGPACTSAHLQVSLGGGAGAGMSQEHTGLQLRNIGSSACTLYGYPGVSWVAGADGHQVGAAAVRQPDNGGSAEKTVTLAPGALASAPLDIVQAAVLPASACKPVPVRGLRVYPPGERAALFLPMPTPAGGYGECSRVTSQPTLSVGWLQPGVQPGGATAG